MIDAPLLTAALRAASMAAAVYGWTSSAWSSRMMPTRLPARVGCSAASKSTWGRLTLVASFGSWAAITFIMMAVSRTLLAMGPMQSRLDPKATRPYPVSYTHLRAHETRHDLVCRLLLEKK